MSEFKLYRRKGGSEMRAHVPGEPLENISVSEEDRQSGCLREPGGMIARNPENHADQWYVNKEWFEANYERPRQI
jgi:hypothetical protein